MLEESKCSTAGHLLESVPLIELANNKCLCFILCARFTRLQLVSIVKYPALDFPNCSPRHFRINSRPETTSTPQRAWGYGTQCLVQNISVHSGVMVAMILTVTEASVGSLWQMGTTTSYTESLVVMNLCTLECQLRHLTVVQKLRIV